MNTSVELTDFAFQCVVATGKTSWIEAAAAALFSKARLGKGPGIRGLDGWSGGELPREVVVGLKVLGFRTDKRQGRGVLVCGAAFHPATKKLLAYTNDLAAVPRATLLALPYDRAALKKGTWSPIAIDKAIEARLRELAGGGIVEKAPAPSSVDAFAHDDEVSGLAVSADGSRLATVGTDRKLAIWDLATGTQLVRATTVVSFAAAFSPDAKLVAVGGFKAAVHRVSDGTKRVVLAVPGESTIRALRVSLSGRWIAAACDVKGSSRALLFDAKTGKLVAQWKIEAEDVLDVAFEAERTLVIQGWWKTGARYVHLPLSKLAGSKAVAAPPAVDDPGQAAFADRAPNGATLAWQGAVLTVRGKSAKTWTAPANIRAAAWTPSNKVVVATGTRAMFWDPELA